MPTWLLIIVILSVGCITSVCVTVRICNHEYNSEWQVISYMGSSVEPKEIYVCKRCNKKVDVKHCYCPNCGANMRNGIGRIYYTNGIKLDFDE